MFWRREFKCINLKPSQLLGKLYCFTADWGEEIWNTGKVRKVHKKATVRERAVTGRIMMI